MSTLRPSRSAARRGSNVRELRPRSRSATANVVFGSPDIAFILTVLLLFSLGMIMVYSTTAAIHGFEDLKRMLQWIVIGVPGLIIALKIPMTFWRKAAPWLLLLCFVALVSLLLKSKNPLAIEVNGAYRWLGIPEKAQVQPSEFAKLAYILFAARFLEKRGQRMDGSRWLSFLLVLGALAGVIYKEPDLGTAMVIGGTAICMLVVAGVSWKELIAGVVVLAALVGLLAWNTPHQKERLLAWQNPWDQKYVNEGGYQVVRSLSAISRGGLVGVGMGQSIYKLGDRLPEAETDFIFAIVAEELGLIRALVVMCLFGVLIWRGYTIASRAPDRFCGLVVVGITSWIAVQSVLNLAVVTGTVPNTGVPLPFISKGGSSLTVLLVATGLVINVSRQRLVKEQRV